MSLKSFKSFKLSDRGWKAAPTEEPVLCPHTLVSLDLPSRPSRRRLSEGSEPRQGFSFQKFQRSPATRGNVRDGFGLS